MEPLKTFFSREIVQRLAADISAVDEAFDTGAFVQLASHGLEERELLGRAQLIAAALAATLPPTFADAWSVLARSLGPEHASDELLGLGMAPFYYLPHVLFVAERGLESFDLAMEAQYELTKRFSAESSLRSYLAADPERTLRYLELWSRDPNPHVRRLVSEGTRPRLPWAARVAWLDEHPERLLGLLERLKDDPASVVRRSVANHLNDLGKVHPQLLWNTCERWLQDASIERRALVVHALRSAVKRGEREALRLLGFGREPQIELLEATFEPPVVAIGQVLTVRVRLRSKRSTEQALLCDLRVHFVGAQGRFRSKVFKGKQLKLRASEASELLFRVSLAVHTTRKPMPGVHVVELLVNGTTFPVGSFLVTLGNAAEP